MIPEGESVLGNNGKPRFSVDQIIELDIMSSDPKFIEESEDKYSMIYAYNTKIDRRHFGGKFYSTKYLGCKSEWDKFNWKVIDKAINGPVKKQAEDFCKQRDKINNRLNSLKKMFKKDGNFTKVYSRWIERSMWFADNKVDWISDWYDNCYDSYKDIPEGYGACDYIDYIMMRWQRSYCQRHEDYCTNSKMFSMICTVNENTYDKFHDFDKILMVISDVRSEYGVKKQDKYDEEQRQRELFKYKNIKYKKL